MKTERTRPLGRFISIGVFLSGHHVDEFETLPRWLAYRYALAGLALCVPVTMTFTGVRQFCLMSGSDPGWWPMVAASVVFVVDFLLVATLGGPSSGAMMLAILRIALALSMSFWIAKPYVSLAYSSQISSEARRARNAEKQTQFDRYDKALEQVAGRSKVLNEHFQQQHQHLSEELKRIANDKELIVQRIIELDRSAEKETLQGQDGRKSGQGEAYNYIIRLQNEKKAELSKLESQEQAIRLQQENLAQSSHQEVEKATADPVLVNLRAATKEAVLQAQNAEMPSITEASDIIDNWVFSGSWLRKLGWLSIHLVLTIIDLLPLIIKLRLPKVQLQRVAQINEERLAAEAEEARKQAPAFAANLVGFRHEASLQHEKIMHFKLMMDELIQLSAHLILRIRQAGVSVLALFGKLSRRHPYAGEAIEQEWIEASRPLRNITNRLLERFERDFVNFVPPVQNNQGGSAAAPGDGKQPIIPMENKPGYDQ